MDRDALLLAGTIAGFVAALLSITEKLLGIRERLQADKSSEDAPRADPAPSGRAIRERYPNWKVINVSSYLLLHELSVIIGAGLLLNYLGLVLSLRLESILYLDMTGTALAALLLGPWWGALVALLSNSLVNWLLYPGPGADLIIFPWALVNMAGGFFWGFLSRRAGFRKYLKTTRASALSHGWYLFTFGLIGAGVMSIPGTILQAALATPNLLALNPDVTGGLERLFAGAQAGLRDQLGGWFGIALGDRIGWSFLNWAENWLRYIPDKTISVAIALAVLKYGFPLFERELIHGRGGSTHRLRDTWAAPVILACLYLPIFLALLIADVYAGAQYWPFWAAPWLVIAGGVAALRQWGPSDTLVREASLERAERYAQALKPIQREPTHDFGQRLTIATLIASVVFALCLPFVLADFYRAAFNFFCVVYGFLLAVHLVRIAISQNLSVAQRR
ncbi:MAG: hypothetical protein ACREJU_00235 [Nitrospiraceae bacterium]